ncbi:hypothetical protein BDY21DRAFT_195317 [Lineolata rhizophorae]|uniref:Uncharacterized protein n=1 Tax=Lineolata rhizophorae TaxID=578093 RepID=A0A6A6P751_9PEZI|nr:hypothetical protein BDY21DRAFT_195317 [Lineolata rhizophorae]
MGPVPRSLARSFARSDNPIRTHRPELCIRLPPSLAHRLLSSPGAPACDDATCRAGPGQPNRLSAANPASMLPRPSPVQPTYVRLRPQRSPSQEAPRCFRLAATKRVRSAAFAAPRSDRPTDRSIDRRARSRCKQIKPPRSPKQTRLGLYVRPGAPAWALTLQGRRTAASQS